MAEFYIILPSVDKHQKINAFELGFLSFEIIFDGRKVFKENNSIYRCPRVYVQSTVAVYLQLREVPPNLEEALRVE